MTRYQVVRTAEKVYILCKCTTMLCYTYIAYIVTQRYTVRCWGPTDKFHSTKISLFLCSLNKTYLYHYLQQCPLVYNSLNTGGRFGSQDAKCEYILHSHKEPKTFLRAVSCPQTNGWQFLATLMVVSNGLKYLQVITPDVLHCTYMFNCI